MKRLLQILFLFPAFLLPVTGCGKSQEKTATGQNFKVEEIVSGLEYPWGMAFLPNRDILVTEREGRLRIVKDGKLDPAFISGLPSNIYVAGQGGLLDVALHPDFSENRYVYLSYAGSGEGGAGTEIARGRLIGNALQDVEVIFKVTPKTGGTAHYGSRLLFLPDQTLIITAGDRYSYMKEAQNTQNHLGAVMRVKDDGTVPKNNPFVKTEGAKQEIYSYGHRNVQGLAYREDDNTIWAHEHGPRGGDEVNIIKPGSNYGWPEITYGIDYSGDIISDKTEAPGMEQPVIYWDPSIAPSGMTFYTGDKFPLWQGDLFVGALAKRHLRRLKVEGTEITEQEIILNDYGRIRDVVNGPDGYLYFLTDDIDGGIYQLKPSDRR